MELRKAHIAFFALALCALALFALPVNSALAQDAIDTSKKCDLTVAYEVDGDPVGGIHARLYKVADVSAEGVYSPVPAFAGSGANLSTDQTDGQWAETAGLVAGFASASGADPTFESQADSGQRASFGGIGCGLYLLMTGSVSTSTGYVYTFQPSLVAVPDLDRDGMWRYETTVAPKFERSKPSGKEIEYRVVKHWADEGHGSSRPQNISVSILKDGIVQSEQVLDGSNDWTYAWKAADDGAQWSVFEKGVPEGYRFSASAKEHVFMVTNTYQEPPQPTPPADLPKTGDRSSWIIVVLLSIAGLSLIVAALVRAGAQSRSGKR